MQPNSEPSPQDIASVSAHLQGQPAPEPQAPAQMQPDAPVSQPAPTQAPSDPFATMFASEPESVAPVPVAQEAVAEPVAQTPTEPVAQEPVAPVAEPVAPVQEEYQTYDEYIASVTAGIPATPDRPDVSKVDPNDPAAIEGFFDDLVNTAVAKATNDMTRKQAIQNTERKQWDNAFEKYGSLRTNKELRDMVHTIRMGHFNRGVAMTPTQAADRLLASLTQERRAGVVDQQVVTTYESVQPNGGNSGAPVTTTLDRQNELTAVQDGGETALAEILEARIKAGTL